ncbi:MAG: glutaredoxin family protein [Acidimicrobiia bacterium]
MTFVTRSGCHLCEEAEPVVRRVASRVGAALEVVDMDTDDDLIRLYGLRVPVVLGPGGDVLAEGIIDERVLRRAIRRAR